MPLPILAEQFSVNDTPCAHLGWARRGIDLNGCAAAEAEAVVSPSLLQMAMATNSEL